MAGASYAPSAHAISFNSNTQQTFSGTQSGLVNIGNLGVTAQGCVICVDSSGEVLFSIFYFVVLSLKNI